VEIVIAAQRILSKLNYKLHPNLKLSRRSLQTNQAKVKQSLKKVVQVVFIEKLGRKKIKQRRLPQRA